jgi:hypothetical protein
MENSMDRRGALIALIETFGVSEQRAYTALCYQHILEVVPA